MHLYNLHCLRLGRFHWLSTEQNWPILSSQSSASVLLSFFTLTGVCFFLSGHQFCFLTLSPSVYDRSPHTNCTKCSVNPQLQSYMQTFGCGLQKVALRFHPRSCCSSWTCLCLSPWGFSSFCSFYSPERFGEQADQSQLSHCCNEQMHSGGGVRQASVLHSLSQAAAVTTVMCFLWPHLKITTNFLP